MCWTGTPLILAKEFRYDVPDWHIKKGAPKRSMSQRLLPPLIGSNVGFLGEIKGEFKLDNGATIQHGDRLELLPKIPSGAARLIVTSPPYNIGKQYEQKQTLNSYLEGQRETITECVRTLADDGSLC